MIKEQKTTFTQEEVEQKVKTEIEKQNFAEAMRLYSLTANRMVSDIAADKTKNRVLNMDSETIKTYLESPDKYINNLLDLSLTLFISVPQYQNIIKYFVDMIILVPYISPIKVTSAKSKFKKEFIESAYSIDKMNVELEYKKAIANTLLYGSFCGYELEEKDSYSIKQFNPKICRTMGTVNGKNVYAIDMSYFKGKKMLDGKTPLINSYPKEIQSMYSKYESDSANMRWQMPEVEKQICLRWNNFLNAPSLDVPPLVSLAPSILDLQDYKDMQKTKTANDNYRYLALEMQTSGKEGMNQFTVDPSFVSSYYEFLVEQCGNAVTPFISPVPVKEISFGSKMSEVKKVDDASKALYDSAGISEILFGNGASNSGTLKFSTLVDQGKLFELYEQIGTILSTKINMNSTNVYKVKVPKVTTFNISDKIKELKELATLGIPVLDELLAISNISSGEVEGRLLVEETFGYKSRFVPLSTSYTQSGNPNADGEVGAPTKNVEDLTESGESTQNLDSNANRV